MCEGGELPFCNLRPKHETPSLWTLKLEPTVTRVVAVGSVSSNLERGTALWSPSADGWTAVQWPPVPQALPA